MKNLPIDENLLPGYSAKTSQRVLQQLEDGGKGSHAENEVKYTRAS